MSNFVSLIIKIPDNIWRKVKKDWRFKKQTIEAGVLSFLQRDTRYQWPATVFVNRNTKEQQIHHILSEAFEVAKELKKDSSKKTKIHSELADLTHSLETFWRILEQEHGASYVRDIFCSVFEKNEKRGYYEN